jgi:hypothetical protein
VASNESRGNHLGDSYLYAGFFDGIVYHGVMQFDLSAVPRGATIYDAVLEIAGLDDTRLGDAGVWEVRVLGREADADWSRTAYGGLCAGELDAATAAAAGDLARRTYTFIGAGARLDLERGWPRAYTVSFGSMAAGRREAFAWTRVADDLPEPGPMAGVELGALPRRRCRRYAEWVAVTNHTKANVATAARGCAETEARGDGRVPTPVGLPGDAAQYLFDQHAAGEQ